MRRLRILLIACLLPAVSVGQAPSGPDTVALRVMTYNVHSCRGRDLKVMPERIAQVIAHYRPDIVALQEVRVGRVDPNAVTLHEPVPAPFTHQPRLIAEKLQMEHLFYPLVERKLQDYGLAILSRHPMRLVRAVELPTVRGRLFSEKRGAMWVEIHVDGVPIQIVNTHLGISEDERIRQVRALVGPDWLGGEKFRGAFVLCGDFNARPGQTPYLWLAKTAVDAVHALQGSDARATWPSSRPFFRIDHVFVPRSARTVASDVPRTPLTKVSSDHLPVIVDLVFEKPPGSARRVRAEATGRPG